VAEKGCLERVIGWPVTGVCMHGGELTCNISDKTMDAVEAAGFLYETSSGMDYYFPYRPIVNGRMRSVYRLNHGFSDVKLTPGRNYARDFCDKVMQRMDTVYEQNGVFVLMLHPVYFGFFAYLSHPKNLARVVRFFWDNLRQ